MNAYSNPEVGTAIGNFATWSADPTPSLDQFG
jgi:hypothetical protein